MMNQTNSISVVIPVYKSENIIENLYSELKKELEGLKLDYEVILVNDCSPDGVLEKIQNISKKDKTIKLLSLRKNVGYDNALMAGLHEAKNAFIVIMDDDLQHPPEEIPKLYYFLKETKIEDKVKEILTTEQNFNKLFIYKIETKVEIKKYFEEYLVRGGMPEYLQYRTKESLKKVYDDILYRDIIVRYDLKESKSLRELSLYFISNIAAPFSYNKLKTFLNLGSVNTVKSYLEYLENSFLFFSISRFSHSLKQQSVSPKKIYCIDNGLAQNIAFAFSENKGKFLENLVFLELQRRRKEVYYYKTKDGFEVDFAIKEGREINGRHIPFRNSNTLQKAPLQRSRRDHCPGLVRGVRGPCRPHAVPDAP